MTSYCIIGDLHGDHYWKKIIKENKVDRYIFLGDYFDSLYNTVDKCLAHNSQLFSFASQRDDITLLLGNHDYHYMGYTDSRYSGYNRLAADKYRALLDAYYELFKIVEIISFDGQEIILSHAGVTQTFLREHHTTLEDLNKVWVQSPEIFDFIYKPGASPYGNDSFQGPLWVRPQALLEDMIPGYQQIVGHTNSKEVVIEDGGNLIIVCTHREENNFILLKG